MLGSVQAPPSPGCFGEVLPTKGLTRPKMQVLPGKGLADGKTEVQNRKRLGVKGLKSCKGQERISWEAGDMSTIIALSQLRVKGNFS